MSAPGALPLSALFADRVGSIVCTMASSAGLQALSPFEMYVLAPQQVPVVSPFKDGGCPTRCPTLSPDFGDRVGLSFD